MRSKTRIGESSNSTKLDVGGRCGVEYGHVLEGAGYCAVCFAELLQRAVVRMFHRRPSPLRSLKRAEAFCKRCNTKSGATTDTVQGPQGHSRYRAVISFGITTSQTPY
jgi:hypothetical protein